MNWSDERYVRLYTRDTAEWELLPWQSRALWPLLLRKVDRSGIMQVGKHGVRGVAALVKLPIEVVEPGIEGLLADGCLAQPTSETFVVPNFIEAQEAIQSEKRRAQEYRERKRAEAMGVTESDEASRNVTERHASVTENHAASRGVTDRHAASLRTVPSRAVPETLAHPAGERASGSTLALVEPKPTTRFDLDALYAAYPRKEGKAKGLAKLRALITTDGDYTRHRVAIDNLLTRVARDGIEAQFIPHFSTWVAGKWLDYADGVPPSTRGIGTAAPASPSPARPPLASTWSPK